jgi:outer membrane immunogenic protein
MWMRSIVSAAAAAALIGVALPAKAADMRTRGPARAPVAAPYAPVPYFSWTGLYFGLNGGGGWGRSSHTDTNFGNSTGEFGISGGLIGGTLGYNYQVGSWVWGLEGDLDWARIHGSSGPIAGVNYDSYLHWLGTVRGRVGFAFDRFMPYFTGGLAVGDVKGTITNPPVTILSGTNTQTGWTLGAGVEYAFTPSLSGKAEYLYVDLGSSTPIPGDSVDLKTHVVRGGLNWRFNWDGPRRY